MHSADVVHSFWIPRLGGKRDVNPQPALPEGRRPRPNHLVFTIREPGTYSGQCAEYCGASHAIMRMTAVAMPEPEFEEWVLSMRDEPANPPPAAPDTANTGAAAAGQVDEGARPAARLTAATTTRPAGERTSRSQDTATASRAAQSAQAQADAALVEEGERIFTSKPCVACHAIANTTAKGMLGPNLTRFGTRPTIGAGALPNTRQNLERWITNPRSVKPGALMPGIQTPAPAPGNPSGPPFPATGLTPDEVRAVAAYLSSLK